MLAAKAHSSLDADGTKKTRASYESETLTLYLGFFALSSLVYQSFQGIGLSTLPTLSLGMQVLALLFLRMKVGKTKNVCGISAKSLMMQAAVHSLRLCSTTWLKGYIPADETGDWLYQLMDMLMLGMCLVLLHSVLKTHRGTYQEDCDTFDVKPALLLCFLAAVFVHPDLNDRVLFDSLWAAALYMDVVAMMPQLWMMSKVGRDVEALTGHYVAAIACARTVNFVFWYYGFSELAPVDGSFNLAGWTIIFVLVLQLLLLADFMYYYVKACVTSCAKTGTCGSAPISLAANISTDV